MKDICQVGSLWQRMCLSHDSFFGAVLSPVFNSISSVEPASSIHEEIIPTLRPSDPPPCPILVYSTAEPSRFSPVHCPVLRSAVPLFPPQPPDRATAVASAATSTPPPPPAPPPPLPPPLPAPLPSISRRRPWPRQRRRTRSRRRPPGSPAVPAVPPEQLAAAAAAAVLLRVLRVEAGTLLWGQGQGGRMTTRSRTSSPTSSTRCVDVCMYVL